MDLGGRHGRLTAKIVWVQTTMPDKADRELASTERNRDSYHRSKQQSQSRATAFGRVVYVVTCDSELYRFDIMTQTRSSRARTGSRSAGNWARLVASDI